MVDVITRVHGFAWPKESRRKALLTCTENKGSVSLRNVKQSFSELGSQKGGDELQGLSRLGYCWTWTPHSQVPIVALGQSRLEAMAEDVYAWCCTI